MRVARITPSNVRDRRYQIGWYVLRRDRLNARYAFSRVGPKRTNGVHDTMYDPFDRVMGHPRTSQL